MFQNRKILEQAKLELLYYFLIKFSGGSVSKESACNARDHLQWGTSRFSPWAGKIPCRRKWQPALVFSSGKFHGQRNLSRVHGVSRVGHDLATKPPPALLIMTK